MPDLKISQLPVASTPLAGTELVPIVQGGVTDRTTVQAIMTSTVPSGTANGVLFLNGSKVATSGSALTFDGALLAVGGTATEKITTNGAIRVTGSQTTAGTGTYLSQSTTSLGELAHYGPDNLTLGQLRFYLASANGGIGGEQMRLTSTGLGIGTSSPASRLDVGGTTALNWAASGTSSALATIGTQGTSGASLFVNTASVNSNYASGLAIDGSYASTVSTINIKALGVKDFAYKSQLTFSTTDSSTLVERMRIDPNGNLIQTAPTTPPTLSTNGTMVFNLTSNTNLRVSVRGSDGVTRVADLTLA